MTGKKLIKVMHIITDLQIGGAEMMLYKLLSFMDHSQFENIVVSLSDHGMLESQIKELGVPVCNLGMKPPKPSLKSIRELLSCVRKYKPDIIQGWMYHGNIAVLAAGFFCFGRAPVLWNVRQSICSLNDEKKTSATAIKLTIPLSRFPARILYNSQESRRQHEALGYSQNRGVLIPNGFDLNQFKPSEEARVLLRSQLNLRNDTILIGIIARYHSHKDHFNFLKAAVLLIKDFPDVHFVMVGREVDSKNQGLIEFINETDLSGHVHLLGEQKEVQRLIAAMDIITLSSYTTEAFPNVIGEAMACGVPCVATDVGDTASIIGDTGIIVPPRNPTYLATGWMKMIELGYKKRIVLGELARRRIKELYSIQKIGFDYENIYKEVMNIRIK
jgi:glycosyltransferase involved in cell wall biosynthesis